MLFLAGTDQMIRIPADHAVTKICHHDGDRPPLPGNSQRIHRILRAAGISNSYRRLPRLHAVGGDSLMVTVNKATAVQSQIKQFCFQICSRSVGIFHAEDIDFLCLRQRRNRRFKIRYGDAFQIVFHHPRGGGHDFLRNIRRPIFPCEPASVQAHGFPVPRRQFFHQRVVKLPVPPVSRRFCQPDHRGLADAAAFRQFFQRHPAGLICMIQNKICGSSLGRPQCLIDFLNFQQYVFHSF